MKFTEANLEEALISLLQEEGYAPVHGSKIVRHSSEVLIKEDLENYLAKRYAAESITAGEIASIIGQLRNLSAANLYESNRAIMKMIAEGFMLKREDQSQVDLYVELIDYAGIAEQRAQPEMSAAGNAGDCQASHNIYKVVNQLEITGDEKRIPDAIIYINGLPLVVFELKSATREEATINDAYQQLTDRYRRDIPELFKYNAFCVISDGANSKMGSLFAPYDGFYTWRRVDDSEPVAEDSVDSLGVMVRGLFNVDRLRDVVRNFIYFPDTPKDEEKVVCRYPQYYAARKLFENIKRHRRPAGDGKGGTYFGATGCGKSFTMLFLTRLLMRSLDFGSPTVVLITDRTDLDDQLSGLFVNAKDFVGDYMIVSVSSRRELRGCLKDRQSGGVFLTTIQKFNEDTDLLTKRNNVICISDEAHRTQINLERRTKVTEAGLQKVVGFAYHLHNSLPNATFVGFTGTPIDETKAVFGDIADSYGMAEAVHDEITVKIVYEGRAARVILDNSKLREIEEYYDQCAEEGTSEYQIDKSKRATASIEAILGDPDRLRAVAKDFVGHYERRVEEGATIKGKAIFVSSNRTIAYNFYQEVIALRSHWADGLIKLVMTRNRASDPDDLYELVGDKNYRRKLDRQFKKKDSDFKIAIVVDMWSTGFDVPPLDTIYIDKPIRRHNLIQTISRVNRRFEEKEIGLVVDYIGIKKQMDLALSGGGGVDIEDVESAVVVVRDQLDLLRQLFHGFDWSPYFKGDSRQKLECLNKAAEFVQLTQEREQRFMGLVKRMKAAYDICCAYNKLTPEECDQVNFHLAVRSILNKLSRGDAPDMAQMNARVRELIEEALLSNGVEEIIKLGKDKKGRLVDIFDKEYLERIKKIELPNTKVKLLKNLLERAIDEFKKINRVRGIDFSKRLKTIVDKYNQRRDGDLVGTVVEDFTNQIISLIDDLKKEKDSYHDIGLDIEQKAFYDILKELAEKYNFEYPEDKLLHLAKEVKVLVDDKVKYTDWNHSASIQAELKTDLIMLLWENKYPPVEEHSEEVYREIFEQAENFKKYQNLV